MTDRQPAAARTAPIALWRIVEAFLHQLHDLFGGPERIAARCTLPRDQHRLFHIWITAGENLIRHLLLLEARACTPQAAPARRASKRSAQRERYRFDPNDPDSWRVSFSCLKSRSRAARLSKRRPTPHPRLYLTRPLAERIEALIRVFNDPTPYAKRLARRLRATPKRAAELTAPCRYMARFVYPEDIAAIHAAHASAPTLGLDTT